MKQIIKVISVLILLIASNSSFAQKGIFCYPDTFTSHTQIVDIVENEKNNDIYMLGITKDLNFKHTKPFFARIHKNGNLIFKKYFKDEVRSMCNMILVDDNIEVYGTNSASFSQYDKVFDINGKKTSNTTMLDITSGLVKKVVSINNKTSLRLSTRRKGKYFNIRISRIKNNLGYAKSNFPIKVAHHELADDFCMLKDSSLIILGIELDDNYKSQNSVIHKYSINNDSIWSIKIPNTKGAAAQCIAADKNDNVHYACSFVYKNYTAKTYLFNIEGKAKFSNKNALDGFIANGMISLDNGNSLLFGYKYGTVGKNVIRKAKYVIIDNKNKIIKQESLKETDKPDSEMTALELVEMPSSSEFLTAEQLYGGRIALAGRVYYPVKTSSKKKQRLNKPLLVIMTKDGIFR